MLPKLSLQGLTPPLLSLRLGLQGDADETAVAVG
jgi:hypothetical protein